MSRLYKFLVFFLILFVAGCGEQSSSSSDDPSSDDPPTTEAAAVDAIQLTTEASSIGTNESTTISVRLFDSSGQIIQELKNIEFSLSNPALGSISSPVTTSSGFAAETFTARDTEGSVTIRASADSVTAEKTIQISDAVAAFSVEVSANPEAITVGGTSVVRAEVFDGTGSPMPDGTTVNFSLNNDSLGTVVSSATTSDGVALATFSADETNIGRATVTASAGSASGNTIIEVKGAAAGSIEFSSATPQIIVIQGAGGQEDSILEFLVKDSNGNPVAGSQNVRLELSGPNGGEYIGNTPGISEITVGTDAGIARTTLHSGTIPGTATIIARVVGTELVTSSGVIAIGGGTPSAGHFSLSTERFNLEGLAYDNITTSITTLIADRYGNYNVLEGTTVSFYAECGAIDRAVALNNEGAGSVTFRTQEPRPHEIAEMETTIDVADDFLQHFGLDITIGDRTPANGLCTIVTVVDGEEKFIDANGNGVYDEGEIFVDTYDDIHLDKDDSPMDLDPTETEPGYPFDPSFEDLIVDRNGNGTFDGMNGVWDANKRIARQIKLLMTGIPRINISKPAVSVADGGSESVYFSIHDQNYNPPIADTSFSVTLDGAGELSGTTEHTYLDTNSMGAKVFFVTISDGEPGDSDPEETGTLEFSWTWKGGTYTESIPVTVD